MDEYDQGMDPQIKRYFNKIVRSFSFGLLWMLSMATIGFYFGAALVGNGQLRWYNIVFYLVFLASLFVLIRFFYRVWKN